MTIKFYFQKHISYWKLLNADILLNNKGNTNYSLKNRTFTIGLVLGKTGKLKEELRSWVYLGSYVS